MLEILSRIIDIQFRLLDIYLVSFYRNTTLLSTDTTTPKMASTKCAGWVNVILFRMFQINLYLIQLNLKTYTDHFISSVIWLQCFGFWKYLLGDFIQTKKCLCWRVSISALFARQSQIAAANIEQLSCRWPAQVNTFRLYQISPLFQWHFNFLPKQLSSCYILIIGALIVTRKGGIMENIEKYYSVC